MAEEAAVPPGLWERIQHMIDQAIAKFAQSGFLRNARITGGAGLTISDGGALRLQTVDGVTALYVGGGTPALADGSPQPLTIMRRADGTLALAVYDPDPLTAGFQQQIALYDRNLNRVVADDLVGGLGLGRPYLAGGLHRARFADWTTSTTSATFETLWRGRFRRTNPWLVVGLQASMDTAATTGEVKVLVNGVQLGSTSSQTFAVTFPVFGPAVAPGSFMAEMDIEVQAKRTSAGGAVRVEPWYMSGAESS